MEPVSILMSVFNAEKTLKPAIESILDQTYGEFEFVIVNDGSKDATSDILSSYEKKDGRIKLIENTNHGIAYSLNLAYRNSSGCFIARMDADDIARTDRFKKQIEFLKMNPSIDLVGSAVVKIDDEGREFGVTVLPGNPRLLKRLSVYRGALLHPTWMARRGLFEKMGGYRLLPVAQDVDFISRALDSGAVISNIQEPLLYYRVSSNNISNTKSILQRRVSAYIGKLHRQRKRFGKDNFSPAAVARLTRANSFINLLHTISHVFFLKAMKHKDAGSAFHMAVYLLLSLLISPYQIRFIWNGFRAERIMRGFKTTGNEGIETQINID